MGGVNQFEVALFVGAAMTATSVGITARVFGDLGALKTKEAKTIIGAAVVDDILGLLILTVVAGVVTGVDVVVTAGIGSGQPSRLDSCQIAIDKMKKFTDTNHEVVAASDAFFPFVDGIEKLVQSGVTAVIQPSGSIRDKEIINFANETDTILVFSKTRHFRH